ncbi:hypothetical protein Y032_0773g2238 [Ancylostoma ceylanicum]|uniref:Uncharacterized protein n=1 Tax=Ancylostoma ceylanicum TaxID=53326 RepID=A0A016WDG7_9BILA|nr:hypothetical protein Y032_0773g2238 [Ancylostoma ceylanicum]
MTDFEGDRRAPQARRGPRVSLAAGAATGCLASRQPLQLRKVQQLVRLRETMKKYKKKENTVKHPQDKYIQQDYMQI